MKRIGNKKADRASLDGGAATSSTDARLSPRWAFVVFLRTDADVERSFLAGRAEHVSSGRATHFSSLDELLGFFARVLREIGEGPQ